ncbi:hypothetical protein [Chitinimonas sp. BJYL2]|uniref:hypothetical protein n=1 Tax=Chitinimonas sp. BJYL2 TaxID=2976696 RepID=UPI0022B5B2DD|nr:hypothetical protein [Chitinimonas sp. BJYL2]
MTTLCIQIQPDRTSDYDEAELMAVCDSLKVHKPLITSFAMETGDDEGPWVNLMFETDHAAKVWPILQAAFYPANAFGDRMRASSMAMCTGEEGWEDYLLLYHYDPNPELDSLDDAA